jgi:FtsH-binding integral membrane protein
MLPILKTIICLLTAATGAFSLFQPNSTVNFTGLQPIGGRGISEIRAVLGGLFIALGVAPMIFKGDTFKMLGWAYLGIALVRIVSIFFDNSSVQSNWISLAVEIIFGIILIL